MTNLELSKKYQEKDAAGYSATLEKAGKVFQKNPLFMAKNLMLKGEDEGSSKITGKMIRKSCLIMRLHADSCWEYVTTESEKKSREKNVWNM